MRAVLIKEFGGPEVLDLAEVAKPVPGPGQVLVRVDAIGVSAGETQMRAGVYPLELPAVFGAEAAGTVEELGAGVDPALAGAEVVAITGGTGSYAEFAVVDAKMLTRVPEGLSTTDALASAAPGAVALALLHLAELRGGETVLVEGGSGKVGGYLVRHARERGAGRIVATAGAGAERVRELGADLVLDHRDPEWTDGVGEVDVVFEMAGGTVPGRLLDTVAPGGKVLLYGTISGEPPVLDPATVLSRGLRLIGCGGPVWARQVLGVHYPEFVAMAAAGGTHLVEVDEILPLEEAAEAHRRIEAGARRILLRP